MFKVSRSLKIKMNSSDGFSLAEVLVAVGILGTLATASLYLTINGIASSEAQRRTNVAVTLAGNAMESVVAYSPAINASTGVSAIYNGRTADDTFERWAVNESIAGFDRMYPGWDPVAVSGATPEIPLTRNVTVNGTVYSVETMIGKCYQPLAGGECTTLAEHVTAPSTTPPGFVELTRVITVIWWFAGNQCESGCSYHASTLVDTSTDLQWVTNE